MAGDDDERQYSINNQATFDAVTGEGHELAALYAYAKLDCLVRLAHLVSVDFFKRPEYYKEFRDPDIANALAQLRARYGSDENFPSEEQRAQMLSPLFEDSSGDFARARDALLSAAATYSEWGQATGQAMLREAVRTTHETFLGQLTLFNGVSSRWSRNNAFPKITSGLSYRILREAGVAGVFGVTNPPGDDWPYREDANGDQLVDDISHRLENNASMSMTRNAFRRRQRAALRGAEAISVIVDFGVGSNEDGDHE